MFDFVVVFEIVSYAVYCDDVAMLTFSRQTPAADKDAERSRILEEQMRLRIRLRELEESVAGLERRAAEARGAKTTWSNAYWDLKTKYDALCSSRGSSADCQPP